MLHTSTASSGTMTEKGFHMTRHRMKRNEFRLGNGATVTVEYWIDPTTINVAAYDTDGHQASIAVYQASLDAADNLNPQIQGALIDSMANALEYDLINKPERCLRKQLS